MNLATWLNEQARLVRDALLAGNLNEARNALRFIFEDGGAPEGIRPDLIIRLALFPLDDDEITGVRSAFIRQSDRVFVHEERTYRLDREIRASLYGALYAERH